VTADRNTQAPGAHDGDLALYELQKPLVEPLLRMFRMTNTALDMLFYDVGAFTAAMFRHGAVVDTRIPAEQGSIAAARNPLLNRLDLGALTNPEGSILVVDAQRPPYVERFDDMTEFLAYANGPSGEGLRSVSITGVGSSALGSAAFAWNVANALREPVAAIIPGYGLADVVPQALGGWFGLGLHDWLQSTTQSLLAATAPSLALMGRRLARTSPHHARTASGAPVFEHGSAASDDLHGVLLDAHRITRVIGHSKGSLAIANALRSLPPERGRATSRSSPWAAPSRRSCNIAATRSSWGCSTASACSIRGATNPRSGRSPITAPIRSFRSACRWRPWSKSRNRCTRQPSRKDMGRENCASGRRHSRHSGGRDLDRAGDRLFPLSGRKLHDQ
jgi:hypothetical protein